VGKQIVVSHHVVRNVTERGQNVVFNTLMR
jgi:hypothetical protein